MFPRILANTADDQAGANPELTIAKQTIKGLRAELAPAEGRLVDTEARAIAAERWPQLPAASVAIIAGASAGYVSEVLKSSDGR